MRYRIMIGPDMVCATDNVVRAGREARRLVQTLGCDCDVDVVVIDEVDGSEVRFNFIPEFPELEPA